MSFREQVYFLVRQIPSGKVATYGQIAALAGNHRAARQVGFALRALGIHNQDVPWWRVVNRTGYISIDHGNGGAEKMLQAELLKREGVEISAEMYVDLDHYRYSTSENNPPE